MKWTKSLINTLREVPQEAEIVSHQLMLRAGLIRRLSGGLYNFMPLGLRALRKVEKIVREEMDRAGALEILMPALQPAELWQQSGRFDNMGASMFRLRDRADRTMVLGPTHEEVVTELASHEIISYRQLPCTLYQIQTKFRDEIRPRFGLMRSKEFIMKDAYSFDVSSDAADISYEKMYNAYTRIFERCGLHARPVEADSGAIGGNHSHEFMVPAEAGEDGILVCPKCKYAANQERAERMVDDKNAAETSCGEPEEVATPGAHTVHEAAVAVGVEDERIVKSLVYLADGKPILAIVEGPRELNELKLRRVLDCGTLEMADDETTQKAVGCSFGSIGPIGVKIPVYADIGLRGAQNVVVGANKDGFHIKNVSLARDCEIKEFADIITVSAGDRCPKCGAPMSLERGIEVGHVFKLGTKYTKPFNATVLLEGQTNAETLFMGCYGIGVTRTLQAVIEQSHDENGIIWPTSVAPYVVSLLVLDPRDPAVVEAAEKLERELEEAGIDVLVDDREERPGVKFKDADLIGSPFRVVAGAKALAKGAFEIRPRREKESQLIPTGEALAWLRDHVNNR